VIGSNDLAARGIKILHVAGLDLHRAKAHPHQAGIQKVEIDELEQRGAERRGVIDADRLRRALWHEHGRRNARLEEAWHATAASAALVSLKIRRELS
jgi:hypothetical protein